MPADTTFWSIWSDSLPLAMRATTNANTCTSAATMPQISASSRLTEWLMAEWMGSAKPIRLPANAIAAAVFPARINLISLCGVTSTTMVAATNNTAMPAPK